MADSPGGRTALNNLAATDGQEGEKEMKHKAKLESERCSHCGTLIYPEQIHLAEMVHRHNTDLMVCSEHCARIMQENGYHAGTQRRCEYID